MFSARGAKLERSTQAEDEHKGCKRFLLFSGYWSGHLRVLEALDDTFSISFQFRSLLIVIPRYLAVSADFNSILWSLYGRIIGFFFSVFRF